MAVVRNIVVRIGADILGYQRNLNQASNSLLIFSNGLNRGMTSVVNNLGLGKLALASFSIAAVTAFGVVSAKAIKSAADVIESENLFNASMGSMGAAARVWSEELSNSLGLNAYEVRRNVGLMYNMSSSLGVTRDKAYELSTNLTALAYDMSSFFNTSYEEMSEKILSAMTGQTKPLKELGVAVYETQVKQYAYANGIAAVGEELTETQKVMARYGVIMSQTKNAQGDMARTIMSPANQLRVLQTQLQLTMINLGMAFMPIWQRVLPALVSFGNYLKYVSSMFANFMQAVFGKVIQPQSAALSMADMAEATEDAAAGQEKLGKEAKKAKGALAGFDEINQLNDGSDDAKDAAGAAASSPGGATDIPTPLNQIDTETFTAKIDTLKSALKLFYEEWGMKDIIDGIKRGFTEFDYSGLMLSLSTIGESINTIILSTIPDVKKTAKSLGSLIGTHIAEGIQTSLLVLDAITAGIAKFYADNTPNIINFIKTLCDNLSTGFTNLETTVKTVFDALQESININKPFIESTVANIAGTLFNISSTAAIVISDMFSTAMTEVSRWVTNNNGLIVKTFNSIIKVFGNSLTTISKITDSALTTLLDFWNTWGKDIFKGIINKFLDIAGWLLKFFNDVMVPVFDRAMEWVWRIWNESLSGVWKEVLGFIGRVATIGGMIYDSFIKPLINIFMTYLLPGVKNSLQFVVDIFGELVNGVMGIVKNLLKIFNGLLDFVVGVFSGDWGKAWTGVVNIFAGLIGAIAEPIKAVVNAVIDALNFVIRNINSVAANIPGVSLNIGEIGRWSGVNSDDLAKKILNSPENTAELSKQEGIGVDLGGKIELPSIDTSSLQDLMGQSGSDLNGYNIAQPEETKLNKAWSVEKIQLPDISKDISNGTESKDQAMADTIASAVGSAVLSAIQFNNNAAQNSEATVYIDGSKLARIMIPAIEKEKSRLGNTAIIQSV